MAWSGMTLKSLRRSVCMVGATESPTLPGLPLHDRWLPTPRAIAVAVESRPAAVWALYFRNRCSLGARATNRHICFWRGCGVTFGILAANSRQAHLTWQRCERASSPNRSRTEWRHRRVPAVVGLALRQQDGLEHGYGPSTVGKRTFEPLSLQYLRRFRQSSLKSASDWLWKS